MGKFESADRLRRKEMPRTGHFLDFLCVLAALRELFYHKLSAKRRLSRPIEASLMKRRSLGKELGPSYAFRLRQAGRLPYIKETARSEESRTMPTEHTRFDSLAQEVYLGLWRTFDRLRALEDELFARFELTAQQYNVLRLLKAAHPGSVPTLSLAERLVSRAPDVTRIIDRLKEGGLVSRERSTGDRRIVRVAITDAGLSLLKKIAGPLAECHAKQLGHLPQEDLQRLSELLREARQPHEPDRSVWR